MERERESVEKGTQRGLFFLKEMEVVFRSPRREERVVRERERERERRAQKKCYISPPLGHRGG
jgi:hypothetical protein